ncbi:MAG TPA: two-component system sensor histidine kinase CreC, partial [Rubrivivax sp.]|nr:two-component system sensor histidine kinase CreC [Rubrivivax sp.]
MHLGLRLLFAFVAITGLAAFFVLRVFVTEIKPSVGEVMEDLMVDTANLLAEVAAPELQGLPAGAALQDGVLTAAVRRYVQRPVDMQIWGLNKTTLDLRVLLTDANGRVVFDSGTPPATGQDYSQWRDVRLTLRG